MARYIDADELRCRVKTKTNPYGKPTLDYESGVEVLDMIDNAPTADVVPKSEYEKAIEIIKQVHRLAGEVKADIPLLVKHTKEETAREIFKELDKALAYCMESHPYAIERYCEIKRKYIGE